MTKPKRITVAAMADMTRREARITNRLMNDLVEHHVCVDCAINMAVALVKSHRPEQRVPLRARFCSDVCAEALREFFEEMGVKWVPVDGPWPPPPQ